MNQSILVCLLSLASSAAFGQEIEKRKPTITVGNIISQIQGGTQSYPQLLPLGIKIVDELSSDKPVDLKTVNDRWVRAVDKEEAIAAEKQLKQDLADVKRRLEVTQAIEPVYDALCKAACVFSNSPTHVYGRWDYTSCLVVHSKEPHSQFEGMAVGYRVANWSVEYTVFPEYPINGKWTVEKRTPGVWPKQKVEILTSPSTKDLIAWLVVIADKPGEK